MESLGFVLRCFAQLFLIISLFLYHIRCELSNSSEKTGGSSSIAELRAHENLDETGPYWISHR